METLALELRNLTLGDSGIYKLTVIFTAGQQLTAETSLQVFGECVKKNALVCLPYVGLIDNFTKLI